MSFDPNNAPTGSPEEVLGEDNDDDDDGGDDTDPAPSGDTQQAEGGDIDSGGSSGGGSDDSGGSSSGSDSTSSSSGSRTTAPDPSDPPDPDPEDVTTDPDPDTEPAPTEDDQGAEGGEGGGDSGSSSGSQTTAPDPSDPPEPEPEQPPDPEVNTEPSGPQPGDEDVQDVDVEDLPPALRGPIESATQEQRQQIAERLEDETGLDDVNPSEIQTDVMRAESGEFLIDAEVSQSVKRDIAEQRAANRLSEQVAGETREFGPGGPEVTPGEDVTVERTAEGELQVDVGEDFQREFAAFQTQGADPSDFRVSGGTIQPTTEFRKEQAAKNISGAEAEDIRVTEGGLEVTREFQRERAAQQEEDFGPEDFVVRDGEVSVRESALKREASEDFRQSLEEKTGVETAGLERGDEFEVKAEGGEVQAELTARGREAVIGSRLAKQGFVEVEGQEAEVPEQAAARVPGLGDTISTGSRRIPIEDVGEQLVFDDEGNLADVKRPPEQSLSENVAELQDKGFDRATAIGLAGSLSAVQTAGDLSLEAGEAAQPGLEALGTAGGTVSALPGAAAVAATGGGIEGAETTIEAGQKAGSGAAGLVRAGIELPETLAGGVGATGDAGEFVVEEGPVEGAAAAGDAVGDVATQVAVTSAKNPFRTTGQLLGSTAIFKASRAVGPRTNVATRAAIQPGEELLGKGGAATFRKTSSAAERVGASRTASAAEKIGKVGFPRGEPLFASEEAVIMAGGKVRDIAGRGANRARSGASKRVSETVQRSPDIEIGRQVDGRLEISDRLKRQISETAKAPAERTASAARQARERISELPDQARGAALGAEISAEAGLRSAGRRVRQTGDGVDATAERVRSGISGLQERAGKLPEQTRGVALGAEISAEAAARSSFRAIRERGKRAGRRLSKSGQRLSELPEELRGAVLGAEISAEAGLRSLGRSASEAVPGRPRFEGDLKERASEVPAKARGAALGAEISAEAGLRSAGRGVRRRTPGVPELDIDLSEVPAQARGAALGAEISAEAGLRSVGRGARQRVGRGRQKVETRVGEARKTLSDVASGEIGVRVGAVRPPRRRRVIDVPEGAGVEIDSKAFDFESEFESEDSGAVSGGTFESETRTDSGVMVERVRAGDENVEARAETESRREAQPSRVEVSLDQPLAGDIGERTVSQPLTQQAPTSVEAAGEASLTGEAVRLGTDTRLGLESEAGAEVRNEGGVEVESETETDFEQELELEQELEREQELELEGELELEVEREAELGNDRDKLDDERGKRGAGQFSRGFEFDVTKPGEVGKTIDRSLQRGDDSLDDF